MRFFVLPILESKVFSKTLLPVRVVKTNISSIIIGAFLEVAKAQIVSVNTAGLIPVMANKIFLLVLFINLFVYSLA